VLVYICPVNRPRIVVPLLGHGPDVSLDLFGILAISHVVDLKVLDVNCKLGLDDIDRHLLPVNDVQPGDARPSTRLFHIPCEPVVNLDLAVLLPQVRRDDGIRGRLAEEDLPERDDNH
jgi:hypothetical protein